MGVQAFRDKEMTTINYKDHEIHLAIESGNWIVKTDSYSYSNTDLNKVREYIDKQVKTKFERYDVYKVGYGSSLPQIYTITSVADNGEMWAKHNGERTKLARYDLNGVFPINDINKAVFAEWAIEDAKINALQKQINAIAQHINDNIKPRFVKEATND